MSKEITLPSGNTVKLRDPETLLKKDRDKVTEMVSKADNEMMKASLIQDALITISVIEWSFDLVPPAIRTASLGELTPKDYDALIEHCVKAAEYIFPNVNVEDDANDPKVITDNSND